MSYEDALAGRCSLPNHVYHITICTRYRQPVFSNWQTGRLAVQEFKHVQSQLGVQSLAWVLMPDHLHWLLQLNKEASLARTVSIFKGRSARNINQYLARTGGLWQKGFYEQAIRQDEDLRQIARYIVANPLRAGLVQKIGNYPLWDAIWL
ncbi:REP-associated tyrosine transposase [Oceanisphaera sp.]|uniref:REP-associated tyrosine transposase n=1 Tax=Oceanisphaera sp. TaxID=1929979 RepID=UPI003A92883C